MKILLLSGYDAASHKRWRDGLVSFCDSHDWTCLSLPPRFFNWRVRGNSLSWAFSERATLERDYDLLIVTSMVDLSALRGFVPALSRLPTLMYFHENQFDYPLSKQKEALSPQALEPQILSLYGALCADQLLFNSNYNRQTFLDGAAALLNKLPDAVPPGLVEQLQARSTVLPVPLESHCYQSNLAVDGTLQILWNHRWEYDKGPERLLLLVNELLTFGVKFRLHVVGQQFRQQPKAFEQLNAKLRAADCGGQWGYVESENEYRQLLRRCHIVLSTALHDFQGLSVLEAVACGCIPLLPNRQAYPEWFGEEHCYPSLLDNSQLEMQQLAARIQQMTADATAPNLDSFSWSKLGPCYEQALQKIACS